MSFTSIKDVDDVLWIRLNDIFFYVTGKSSPSTRERKKLVSSCNRRQYSELKLSPEARVVNENFKSCYINEDGLRECVYHLKRCKLSFEEIMKAVETKEVLFPYRVDENIIIFEEPITTNGSAKKDYFIIACVRNIFWIEAEKFCRAFDFVNLTEVIKLHVSDQNKNKFRRICEYRLTKQIKQVDSDTIFFNKNAVYQLAKCLNKKELEYFWINMVLTMCKRYNKVFDVAPTNNINNIIIDSSNEEDNNIRKDDEDSKRPVDYSKFKLNATNNETTIKNGNVAKSKEIVENDVGENDCSFLKSEITAANLIRSNENESSAAVINSNGNESNAATNSISSHTISDEAIDYSFKKVLTVGEILHAAANKSSFENNCHDDSDNDDNNTVADYSFINENMQVEYSLPSLDADKIENIKKEIIAVDAEQIAVEDGAMSSNLENSNNSESENLNNVVENEDYILLKKSMEQYRMQMDIKEKQYVQELAGKENELAMLKSKLQTCERPMSNKLYAIKLENLQKTGWDLCEKIAEFIKSTSSLDLRHSPLPSTPPSRLSLSSSTEQQLINERLTPTTSETLALTPLSTSPSLSSSSLSSTSLYAITKTKDFTVRQYSGNFMSRKN